MAYYPGFPFRLLLYIPFSFFGFICFNAIFNYQIKTTSIFICCSCMEGRCTNHTVCRICFITNYFFPIFFTITRTSSFICFSTLRLLLSKILIFFSCFPARKFYNFVKVFHYWSTDWITFNSSNSKTSSYISTLIKCLINLNSNSICNYSFDIKWLWLN